MTINPHEWEMERRRLGRVIDEIDAQISDNNVLIFERRGDLKDTRRSVWQEGPRAVIDFDDVVNLASASRDMFDQERDLTRAEAELDRLMRLKDSPYFARVDFQEQGQSDPENIYIGMHSLLDRMSGEYWVYDWRAPISSLYYDAEIGPAGFVTDVGDVEGEVSLKRQYKIEDGEVVYLFDSTLKIDDEMLQEMLSRSADDKMRNIVVSIQREQNRIIRDTAHRLLIVQGVAGSGKTSIALHRVAYLLYKFRKTLDATDILILSPNEMFNDYISAVLPELGEENMLQTTFQEYATEWLRKIKPETSWQIEDQYRQMEELLSNGVGPSRVQGVRFKSSDPYLELMRRYTTYLGSGQAFDFLPIIYAGKEILSRAEMIERFTDAYDDLPLLRRLEKIVRRVEYLLEPLVDERLQEVMDELGKKTKFLRSSRSEIRRAARAVVDKELQPVKARLGKWNGINALDLYAVLFQDRKLVSDLAKGIVLPDAWSRICSDTLKSLRSGRIYYEDVAPILYLQSVLEGSPSLKGIKHVIVDEAQDYTLFQYEVLRQLFPQSGMTLLGDLNQTIHPYMNIRGYERILDVFGEDRAMMISLTKSYRSTRQIVDFTAALLGPGAVVEPIGRDGEKPAVYRLESVDAQVQEIDKRRRMLTDEGAQSVAIICKTEAESVAVYEKMGQPRDVHLVTRETTDFRTGTSILPVYLAKGLEYDAVLVYQADAGHYAEESDRKLLYTACTRALHHLSIYYSGTLSPFIQSVDEKMYDTEVSV